MFVGTAPVVGHNVEFDAAFLEAHAARVGVPLRLPTRVDTLVLARRFLDLPRYDLASVLTHLGGTPGTAHRALDDARAAADVLVRLAPTVARHRAARAPWLACPTASSRSRRCWPTCAHGRAASRPAALLRDALARSGLAAHYASDAAAAPTSTTSWPSSSAETTRPRRRRGRCATRCVSRPSRRMPLSSDCEKSSLVRLRSLVV